MGNSCCTTDKSLADEASAPGHDHRGRVRQVVL